MLSLKRGHACIYTDVFVINMSYVTSDFVIFLWLTHDKSKDPFNLFLKPSQLMNIRQLS